MTFLLSSNGEIIKNNQLEMHSFSSSKTFYSTTRPLREGRYYYEVTQKSGDFASMAGYSFSRDLDGFFILFANRGQTINFEVFLYNMYQIYSSSIKVPLKNMHIKTLDIIFTTLSNILNKISSLFHYFQDWMHLHFDPSNKCLELFYFY